MDLPDEVLLSKITRRSVYYDRKSKEETTTKSKPKYKLSGKPIPALDEYFFHVLTTNMATCKKALTVPITQKDWEERIDGPYLGEISYCDLTKYELMKGSELIRKIKDKGNGFRYIAILCAAKYEKMQKLIKRMQYHPGIQSETTKQVMSGLLDRTDEIAIRLGLK